MNFRRCFRLSILRAPMLAVLTFFTLLARVDAASTVPCPPSLTSLDLPSGGHYCGEMKNGKLQGHGRIDWETGGYYEGEFENGFMDGQGHWVMPDRDYDYQGQFQRGVPSGKGVWKQDGDIYEGELANGLWDGQGKLTTGDGTVYEGQFKHQKLDGQASMTDRSGAVMEGRFEDYRPVGPVIWTWPTGDRYEGPLKDQAPHGKGVWTRADKAVVRGEFEYGDIEGKAVITYPDGGVYTGPVDDKRQADGKGELHRPNGDVYQGRFAEDQFDGQGTLTKADGTIQAGYWRAGKYLGEKGDGTLDDSDELAKRNVESALYNQQALLAQQFDQIQPSPSNGPARMYALLIAGDGSQEVFRREAAWVDDLFARRFDTRGKTIRLVNSRSSVQQLPLATAHSIELSLAALAQKMNRQRDLLFVYVTSHGSRNHELSLRLRGLGLPNLPAKQLADMLKASGIRNQVVVISACYSGGFIPLLKGNRTWVITASRADRTSFGCADENDFTYFGRALFKESMPGAPTLSAAFQQAERLVAEWENEDAKTQDQNAQQGSFPPWLRAVGSALTGAPHSEPQSAVSPAFQQEVDAWFRAHPPVADAGLAPTSSSRSPSDLSPSGFV